MPPYAQVNLGGEGLVIERLMTRFGVIPVRGRPVPRGWVIVGLAIAAWVIVWTPLSLIF